MHSLSQHVNQDVGGPDDSPNPDSRPDGELNKREPERSPGPRERQPPSPRESDADTRASSADSPNDDRPATADRSETRKKGEKPRRD